MKTLAALSGASLLFLSACGTTTKTFVAEEAIVPADEDDPAVGFDPDGDGEFNNNLVQLQEALGGFGIDISALLNTAIDEGTLLIVADITSKDDTFTDDNKKAEVEAFLGEIVGGGAPLFDGTDQIAVSGDVFSFVDVAITGGNLSTGDSNFVFALPLDPAAPTLLPFSRAQLKGNVTGDIITGGALMGVVNSIDFARTSNGITALVDGLILDASAEANNGAAVSCSADADCAAGQECTDQNGDATATGSCLLAGDGLFTVLTTVDANSNGQVEIQFNEATNTFTVNEAGLLFNLDAAGNPSGVFGGQFDLDLDGDDINESLPLGILFNAKLAVRN